MHLVFMLEEPSTEAFLQGFLPGVFPDGVSWDLHPFNGKQELLRELPVRLKAYRSWLPEDWRIVVLLDEDRQDCRVLKRTMEAMALGAGFATRSAPARDGRFVVLNRIAVEELEAWFLGDITALAEAFPGVPPTLGQREKFRDPDGVSGGTWEALERVLQDAGHFAGGLGKIALAREMGPRLNPARNTSGSFRVFAEGLASIISGNAAE